MESGYGSCVDSDSLLGWRKRWTGWRGDVLHAFAAGPAVAVVEVDAFALQDESADAVLIVRLDGSV